ncbi:MAG TPA: rod shape-determining protein RodA [Gemmatimonadaceae bacterium]|nr:rod shape-determining protein RodA [Gemmatimonadaceae bacterium]
MQRARPTTDWQLIGIACVLSVFGLLMVYSAGQVERTQAFEHLWRKQLVWIVAGVTGAYLVSRASQRFLEWVAVPAYVLALVLLTALLIKGVGTGGAGSAKSTQSWLTVAGYRIGQPSEFAKVAVVMMLAKVVSTWREAADSLRDLWKPIVVVGIPWALIILQHDLGTSMVLVGIFFAMLYWGGVSWTLLLLLASPAISLILAFSTGIWGAWFLILLAIIVWAPKRPYVVEGVVIVFANVVMGVVAPVLWNKIQPYQRDRLLSFINPAFDPKNAGYHLLQSQVAIGSGGWAGKGFTLGTQKRLLFLPEQHTDFIFTVIGEELGFIGITLALAILCVLLLRTVRIAMRSLDPFSGLVAFGLAAAWCVHIAVNVGMTVGLMPITGIPLPFFSYGGSFMLVCWIAVGILVRISASGRGRADMLAI